MKLNEDLCVVGDNDAAAQLLSSIKHGKVFATFFIGSTRTSTIPGISIAGASPEATLYTPTLDAEYVILGAPRSFNVIPVTPEGLPTPAVITRATLMLSRIPFLFVDAGCYQEPLAPHVDLPSRRPGERIDTGKALPRSVVERLLEEAGVLAESIAREDAVFIVGESIPGGTTTAASIAEALGFKALGRMSSSGPNNPHSLRAEVVRRGIEASGLEPPEEVFKAVACVGDPVHIAIAGFAVKALERGASIILAGGTQMAAVLAIMARLGMRFEEYRGRIAVATTRWILEDSSSDIVGLVGDITGGRVPIVASRLSFADAPHYGLRMYEEGYVKEGVGAGGTVVAALALGFSLDEIKKAVYEEYERLVSIDVAGEEARRR